MSDKDDTLSFETPLDRLKFMLGWMTDLTPERFDSTLRNQLKVVSAEISPKDRNTGTAVFALTVDHTLCNAGGNLHGGAVALIFDMCTSMTIGVVSREGFWDTGHVTRTLNCSYLRPAPQGTEVLVECEVIHLGKQLAQLRGIIKRKEDGAVCYTCEHGKVKVEFPGMRQRFLRSAKL